MTCRKILDFLSTYVRRDVNTADVPCLHEEHVVLKGVSAWIREYTVSHDDIHEPGKAETTVTCVELICDREHFVASGRNLLRLTVIC